MSVELKQIDRCQLKNFLETQDRYFYSQTAEYIAVEEAIKIKFEVLGLYIDGELKASSIVTFGRFRRFFISADIHFGPIFSEDEPEVFDLFLKELVRRYDKNWKIKRIRLVPLVVRNFYDDVDLIGENPKAKPIINSLKARGFTFIDEDFYSKRGVEQGLEIRNAYVKELEANDFDSLISTCSKDVSRNIKKSHSYGVKIKFLTADQLDLFSEIIETTGQRVGKDFRHSNTRAIAEHYPEAYYPLAYLDTRETIDIIKTDISQVEAEFAEINAKLAKSGENKKRLNQKEEVQRQLNALQEDLSFTQSMQAKYGDTFIMATGSFYFSKNECIYLQGGMRMDFSRYRPMFRIFEEMLKMSLDKKVKYFNFFGISGINDKSAPDYGVLQFKRKFHGNQEEYLGTYDYYYPLGKFLENLK